MAAVPDTMRAWHCHGYDEDPSKAIAAMTLAEDAPVPKVLAGQVLIRVQFASVNPIDWKLFTGGYHGFGPIAKFPYVPGFDVAGTVVKVGDGAERLKVGDKVAVDIGFLASCTVDTLFGPAGAFAEYAAVPESRVSLVPKGVPLSVAAALPLAGCTSYQALFTSENTTFAGEPLGHVAEGSKVLVLGGASGTGHVAVQMAKIRGATVATTGSTNKMPDGRTKIEWLKSLGADIVIDYKEKDWAEELKGQDYDLIYDCVGVQEDWSQAAQVLKKGGQFISIVNLGGFESTADHVWKACVVKATVPDTDQMLAWIAEGKLSVFVEKIFPFGDVPKAILHNLSGRATGKLVVEVAGDD